jgi:hypothetical protein
MHGDPRIQNPDSAWEGDQQLQSMFQDTKVRAKGEGDLCVPVAVAHTPDREKDGLLQEQADYVQSHPELQAILSDFMSHLLQTKPENPIAAAAEFFAAHAPEKAQ